MKTIAFFFKGGSCIYKCFYHENNYSAGTSYHPVTGRILKPKDRTKAYLKRVRLSKDLDLTVRPDMMNEDKLKSAFSAVGAYLKEKHGLQIGGFSFPIHENTKQKINGHYKKNCRGELWFKGPMFNDKFSPPRLKLDLTADESVVFQPYQKSLTHPYEDLGGGLIANTYTFRDVFAENIVRCLNAVRHMIYLISPFWRIIRIWRMKNEIWVSDWRLSKSSGLKTSPCHWMKMPF